MGVLAQVRKKGRDLRQHNAQNHDLRRSLTVPDFG
jgi:hypothetical protein